MTRFATGKAEIEIADPPMVKARHVASKMPARRGARCAPALVAEQAAP
jgi:hypothetical protein